MRLPFGDEVFDGIACFELLEHLGDHDGLMREIRRVLRPEGRLLLTTPNRLTERFLSLPGGPGVNPHHVSTPTPRELRRVLARHFGEVRLLG
jgi:SAM-dependent methyltransferase